MSHTDDLAVMLEGIKMAVSLGNASSFKKFGSKLLETTVAGCEQFHLHSDEYWKCLAVHMSSSAFHYAGTAKMGVATYPMAVVDSELRVYGVTGLRVVDCSIMPTIASGNTNAPAVMFGEKASDMIINAWKH